jgi:hypothetical protein
VLFLIPFSAAIIPYLQAKVDLQTQMCNFTALYLILTAGVDYVLSLDPLQFLETTWTFFGNFPLTYSDKIMV